MSFYCRPSPERDPCPFFEPALELEPESALEPAPAPEPEPEPEPVPALEPELAPDLEVEDIMDMGTSEEDTVPNSPYSSPSRLSTALSLDWASRTPIKMCYISPTSSEKVT